MVLTEFDERTFVKGIKEEGFEEGIREGIQKGIQKGIQEGQRSLLFSLVNEKVMTLCDAASRAGMSEAEFTAEMESYLKNRKSR